MALGQQLDSLPFLSCPILFPEKQKSGFGCPPFYEPWH